MPSRRPHNEGSVYQEHKHPSCPPLEAGVRPEHTCRGRWVGMLDVTRPGHPRRRKAVYGRTRKEVQRELAKLRREYEAHGDLPSGTLTVEAWLTTWLEDIAASKRVRPSTLASHGSKVRNHLIPELGRHRLDKLSPDHVKGLYRSMSARGLAPATQRQTHAILSRALKVAVREGKATRNVALLIDPPTVVAADLDPLNATEIAAILAACAGDPMESRWLAALMLGLRQGEALGLGWEHVDLEIGTVTIARALAREKGRGLVMTAPKSKDSRRVVVIPGFARGSFERHAARGTTGLVWSEPGGSPIDPRKDWQAWTDLLAKAEVRHVRLHDARHSAATGLMLAGVPLAVAQAILGHSDIKMTAHYSHPDLAAMQAAMALLDARHRAIEA